MNRVYKWNEVSCETMIDIFLNFINEEDWTKDKVLEIQNPVEIARGNHFCRTYICNNPRLKRWIKNTAYTNLIGRLKSWNKIKTDNLPYLCILNNRSISKIIPLLKEQGYHYSYLRYCLGDSNIYFNKSEISDIKNLLSPCWYVKDEKKDLVVDISLDACKKYENKYIRIRVMDYDLWENLINNHISNKEGLFEQDDLDKIKIKGY